MCTMAKRSHKEMSLEDKIALIRASEASPKPTQAHLSCQFSIGRSTVGDILRKKRLYEEAWEGNVYSKRQRLSKTTNAETVNEKLYAFFNQARAKNIPLSGPILQSKALQLAEELDVEDFRASNGWLYAWKKRYNIKQFKISGESADVDMALVDDYKSRIQGITSGYEPDDIFNCDETGLFYRALPDKTLAQKKQAVKGGKCSKDRLTVLLCCSCTGEKLKPLVIGKADKPRAFKGIQVEQLPVQWRANSKAWMNTQCFSEWLGNVNLKMKMHKRKILLFMDNVSSHVASDITLSNVTIKFLPANTTSCLQPLDAGIIKTFKMYFRKRLLHHVVSRMDECSSATELSKQVNVLQAVTWIASAWREVPSSTIAKCFSHCGFNGAQVQEMSSDTAESTIQQLLDTASGAGMQVDMSGSEYLTSDEHIPTESDDILVDSTTTACTHEEDKEDTEEEEEDDSGLSATEALQYLSKLTKYFITKDEECVQLLDKITQVVSRHTIIEKNSMHQTKIHNYFHK